MASRSVTTTRTPPQEMLVYTSAVGVNQIGSHAAEPLPVERVGQAARLDPGRPDDLERHVRPATDRQVRRLEQADARVEQRLGDRSDVRRWVHPWQPGLVEPAIAIPTHQRYHREGDRDLALGGGQLRELADGHASADRDRMRGGERLEIDRKSTRLNSSHG